MPTDPPRSIKEFAALVRRSPETVRRWVRAGKIPAYKPGGRTSRYEIPERAALRQLKRGEQ